MDIQKYKKIDPDLQEIILENRKNHLINPYAFKDENAIRRNLNRDKPNLWRPAFVRDIEKFCTFLIIIGMLTKHRYFPSTTMMTLPEEVCTYSSCQE